MTINARYQRQKYTPMHCSEQALSERVAEQDGTIEKLNSDISDYKMMLKTKDENSYKREKVIQGLTAKVDSEKAKSEKMIKSLEQKLVVLTEKLHDTEMVKYKVG